MNSIPNGSKFLFLVSMALMVLAGCLGKSFQSTSYTLTVPPCNVGFCSTSATGNKTADEGVTFEFDFTTSITGTYFYVVNKPSWMSIDMAGTRLYGIPSGYGTIEDLEIHVYDGTNTEIIGPFDLVIDGDPLVPYAWHIKNTGQKSFSSGVGKSGEDIDLTNPIADGLTGNGVTIAVSDTGVEVAHEDLAANVIGGASRDYGLASPWVGDPTPSDPDDGHGTSVTGLIAAVGWNALGSRGVAPNATFAGFNFIGTGVTVTVPKYVDQADGSFDIFNYSYGTAQCGMVDIDPDYLDQLKYGVTTQRGGLGSLYVKSAGNDFVGDLAECAAIPEGEYFYLGNSNLEGDNSVPYTLVVGALNAAGKSSSYSSPGANLWISAPGGEYGSSSPAMVTTDMAGCAAGFSQTSETRNSFENGDTTLNTTCQYTSIMNGTSSAAPVTSGAIALILEENPALTWRDVKHILAASATVVQPSAGSTTHPFGLGLSGVTYQYGWVTNAAGYKFHNWYGFGRVNVEDAVALAATHTLLPAFVETESPYDQQWDYRSATLNSTTGAIPDASSTGRTVSLPVLHNLVVEAVQVKMNVSHSSVSDLGVEIRSPSGTKSIVLNINSGMLDTNLVDAIFLSNAFYGESSYGTWTVKVVDASSGISGYVQNADIKIFGHVDPSPTDTTAPSAPASITVPATFASLVATPTVTWTASPSSDVIRYEFAIGTTAGAADVVPWQAVGSALTASETGLSLTDGTTYHFNVRAVDSSENVSPVRSDDWTADI